MNQRAQYEDVVSVAYGLINMMPQLGERHIVREVVGTITSRRFHHRLFVGIITIRIFATLHVCVRHDVQPRHSSRILPFSAAHASSAPHYFPASAHVSAGTSVRFRRLALRGSRVACRC